MKKRLAGITLILILALSAVTFPSFAASSYGYTTNRFDVTVQVEDNHVMHVTETIKVDFHAAKHGVYRYIPYDLGVYTIENIWVENDMYETETWTDGVYQKVIRIGDPDETIKGRHTYTIHYDIKGYRDETADRDFFSMDLLPTEWETPIGASKITLQFPKDIDVADFQLYSGYYGFEGNAAHIQPVYDKETRTLTLEASDLLQGQGITLNGQLPEGYWVNPANRDWMQGLMLGFLVGIPLLMALLWLLFGRDPKVIKTVEFYPPEGMSPAEVGYIVDGTIDQKDISSMVIYYADKGYLSVHEYKKKKYELVKQCSIATTDEKPFSKSLFNGLFSDGDRVKMNQLPEDFGDYIAIAKEKLTGYYGKNRKLFSIASRVCRVFGCCAAIALPVLLILFAALMTFNYLYMVAMAPVLLLMLGGVGGATSVYDKWNSYGKGKRVSMTLLSVMLLALGSLLAAAVVFLITEALLTAVLVPVSVFVTLCFVMVMNARTKQSTEWLGKILGFRDFIEAAEVEKLKLMVEENPTYFYDIMPYAYVFGLSDKWIDKFELIAPPAPVWYSGYGGRDVVFDAWWYSRMCRSCMDTCADKFRAAAIAVDSDDIGSGGGFGGFGGGGFSGGGFGGGGGGSW